MARSYFARRNHSPLCKGSGVLRCTCGGPALIPVVVGALAVSGIASEVVSLFNQPKAPGLPPVPSLSDSEKAAKDAQTQQRRAVLAAGGMTNVSGGTGIILGSDVSSVSLVGSG